MKLKWIAGIILPLLLWHAANAQPTIASGQVNAPSHLSHPTQIAGGQIITRKGIVYKGVVVQKVVPDGLLIDYFQPDGGIGIAKLKFADLSDGLQQQFGYNPTNAAAFEQAQTHAENQWRKKLIAEDQVAESKRNEAELADAESRAKWVGSGFFITDNGYLLTCFHVVNHPSTSIQVGTKNGVYDAEIVRSDSDSDVALLKLTGKFSALPLVFSNSVNFGEAVFTIGFPNPDAQGWQPKLTRGEISSLSGFQDNTNQYQISVPTQPGNSGGALIDEHGNVVGIVAATLTASDADKKIGIMPQNVNYAIKSSCAKALLDSVSGWSLKLKQPQPSDNRKFEDVVQASQAAVALVLVE